MLFTVACWLCVVWTSLLTVSILKQQPLRRTTARLLRWVRSRVSRLLLWCAPTPPDADVVVGDGDGSDEQEEEAAAPPPQPSPFAPTQLRVLRQLVRPRLDGRAHARVDADADAAAAAPLPSRLTSAAADADASGSSPLPAADSAAPAAVPVPRPLPLDFAVELQWTAPLAALEAAPRVAVTYELHLNGAAGPPQLDAEAEATAQATAEGDAREDAAPVSTSVGTLVHCFTVAPSHGEVQSRDEAPAHDSAAAMDEDEDGAADSEASFTFSPQKSRPRKRKAPSRSRSRAGRSAVSRLCSGASDPSASSDALPSSSADEAVTPATSSSSHRALPRGSAASSSSSPSAPAAAAASASGSHACGTFEQPGFVLSNPQSGDYTMMVVSSSGSYAAAAAGSSHPSGSQCTSDPVRFSFSLPALLYLVQTTPRSATHARQVLDAFDELLRVLTPRDELRGVQWVALTRMLAGAGGEDGESAGTGEGFGGKIQRRACGVLGALVEWRCVLRDLCSSADLVRALAQLVDARLAHLASKQRESASSHRARKRARPDPTHTPDPARESDGPGTAGAAESAEWAEAAQADGAQQQWGTDSDTDAESDIATRQQAENEAGASDSSVAEGAPQLLDPILENALWFALAAVALHDNQSATELNSAEGEGKAAPGLAAAAAAPPPAASDSESVANRAALRSFLAAGGHMLLFRLASQQSGADWFPTYERATLTALARIVASYASSLPVGDGECILFHLLHQATFGTVSARAILRSSTSMRDKFTNPFD